MCWWVDVFTGSDRKPLCMWKNWCWSASMWLGWWRKSHEADIHGVGIVGWSCGGVEQLHLVRWWGHVSGWKTFLLEQNVWHCWYQQVENRESCLCGVQNKSSGDCWGFYALCADLNKTSASLMYIPVRIQLLCFHFLYPLTSILSIHFISISVSSLPWKHDAGQGEIYFSIAITELHLSDLVCCMSWWKWRMKLYYWILSVHWGTSPHCHYRTNSTKCEGGDPQTEATQDSAVWGAQHGVWGRLWVPSLPTFSSLTHLASTLALLVCQCRRGVAPPPPALVSRQRKTSLHLQTGQWTYLLFFHHYCLVSHIRSLFSVFMGLGSHHPQYGKSGYIDFLETKQLAECSLY